MDSLHQILNIIEDLNLKDGKYLEICNEIKVVSDIIIKRSNPTINTPMIDEFKSTIYLYQCQIEENNRYITNLRIRINSVIHQFEKYECKRNIEKYHLLNTISSLESNRSQRKLDKELTKQSLLLFTMDKLKMIINMDDVIFPKGYSVLRKNELVLLMIENIPNLHYKIKNYNLSVKTSLILR